MLSWLYDMLMSVVAFILGLFGVSMDKKSVSFADDATEGGSNTTKETKESTEAPAADAKSA